MRSIPLRWERWIVNDEKRKIGTDLDEDMAIHISVCCERRKSPGGYEMQLTRKKSYGNIIIRLIFLAALLVISIPERGFAICNDKPCSTSNPGLVGKPIDLFTGQESFRRTDLTIGNIFPITIERVYSSSSTYDNPIGYGWTNNYDRRLYVNKDGSVDLQRENGPKKRIAFKNNAYVSPFDDTGTLTANPGGSFIYTDKSGSQEVYDSTGALTALVSPNSSSLVFTYAAAALTKIEEKDAAGTLTGKNVTFSYNSGGRLAQISDSLGRSVTYAQDSSGNLVTVSAPLLTSTYGYNDPVGNHRMTSILEGAGAYTNTYDSTGRVIRQTHGTGIIDIAYLIPRQQSRITTTISDFGGSVLNIQTRVVQFTPKGKPRRVTDTFGNQTIYTRNALGLITREEHWENMGTTVAPNLMLKSAVESTYDNKGNLLTKKEAADTAIEKTTTYTYDPIFSNVLTVTVKSVVNPGQNKVTAYTYDSRGNNISITETGLLGDGTPYSYTTTFEYDANGHTTKIIGPRTDVQYVSTFSYDSVGNLITTTQPLIGTTTYADFDGYGNPGSITDPNGNTTTYTYDLMGRVLTMKYPGDSAATQYVYATVGCTSCGGGSADNLQSITFPEGNVINYSYDPYGNLNTITDSLGNTINYTYDSEGNRLKEDIKDPSGVLQKTVSYQYDALNRLTRTINPDNTYTQTTYDSLGNRITVIDPNGNSTSYQYDALNHLIAVIQPGSITTSYVYDINNNLTTVTGAKKNAIIYRYDDMGRVYQVISPDTGTTTYSHDPAGNIMSKTDALGVKINYSYDALNRVADITFPSDPGIVYTYDTCVNGKGRLCGMSDGSGTTSYEYSLKGQVTKETKLIDGVTYITNYTYNMNGSITSITYPSGKVVNYSDDAVGRVNGVTTTLGTTTTSLATNITYEPYGNINTLTYGNGLNLTITYDQQYRIASIVTAGIQNLSYVYDATSNITGITNNLDNTKNKTYSYDALNRLTGGTGPWGSLVWTYDPIGNRLTQKDNAGTDVYSYQPNSNRLAGVTGTAPVTFTFDGNGNMVTENTRSYIYNQNQRLITAAEASSTLGEYVYNAKGQRTTKTVSGVTTVFHFDQNGQLIAETSDSGSVLAEHVYVNAQSFAKIDSSGVNYILTDHLGTPLMMTSANGTKVWEIAARPFGDSANITGTANLNFRFPGQYFDAETGLHYNYYRDYEPKTGRYISADPIGFKGGINLYSYVGNNAINRVDPSGLQAKCCNQDFLTCLSNCIQKNDPLNNLGKGLLTALGGTFPKSWIGQPAALGSGPLTTVPSAISLGSGVGNVARTVGRVVSPIWISYGLYLAGIEAHCTGACLGYSCAY